MERHGLVIVHTGDGKGKTTAALGLALRAWGSGLHVLILQFIKGGQKYGELAAVEALKGVRDTIEVRQCGLGFTRRDEARKAEHIAAAKDAVCAAEQEIVSGAWDLIILDEINYAEFIVSCPKCRRQFALIRHQSYPVIPLELIPYIRFVTT